MTWLKLKRRRVSIHDWEIPFIRDHMAALLDAYRRDDEPRIRVAAHALILHGAGELLPTDVWTRAEDVTP